MGQVAPASAQPPVREASATRVLTLSEALATARKNQPDLRRARATTEAALARSQAALAPLLPQVLGTASYQRTTANFIPRPGAIPSAAGGGTRATVSIPGQPDATVFIPSTRRRPPDYGETFNFYNFGLTATQLIYDFGASHLAYRASKEAARAEAEDERAVERDVTLMVRNAFFQARALGEMVAVAQENLRNEQRHLEQAQAFVEVGTRADIDLATARTAVANAQVQLIHAENAYAIAKAALNQAMGRDDDSDYEVAAESLPPLPDEDRTSAELIRAATAQRPELLAMERRARAQQLYVRAAKGGYGPSLNATSSVLAGGTEMSSLVGNWNVGLLLSWPLFQGGATRAQTALARANEQSTLADQQAERLAVKFEVEQARLGVRAAKAVQQAALEARDSAREQLKLAEGRYAEGVGNVVELGDAQVALTHAEGQRVQADYGLSMARALLLQALGRSE